MVLPFVVALVLQDRSIALTPRAMPLDAAMRELTEKTGEAYRATAKMGGRIVLSCGPARPVKTVRDDLAAATWGAWRRSAGGWTLDEDVDGVRERDAARATRRIESIRRAFKALASKADAPFDVAAARALRNGLAAADPKAGDKEQDGFAKVEALSKSMPSTLALHRVILSFTPKELAALPDGRVVFSNKPTRLQRPLPDGAGAAIAGLVHDQNVWADVYREDDAFRERRSGTLTMDPRNYADPLTPGNLRLVLETTVSRGGLRFEAWFVDKDLRVVQFAETEFDATSAPQTSAAPATDPNEKSLTLGGEADAFAAAMTSKPSPTMRAELLDPEKHEPLDFYPAEVVRAIARERKKAATIWLDDNLVAFAFEGFHRASKIRPNTASEWIRQLWIRAFNASERPDAIVFRPRGNATNVDRRRMGDLLRVADANGYVPLDDIADFAAASPPEEDGMPMLESSTLRAILPGSDAAERADWRTLRLWGMFSRETRRGFRNGATIPMGALRNDQREAFVGAILKAERYEIRQDAQAGHPYMALDGEPTELLANGFRTDGALTITFTTSTGVLARSEANDPDEPWSAGYADAWRLASAVADRERKLGEKHYDGLPQKLPGSYVPGTLIDYGFSIALTPTLRWSKSGQYGEFDARAKAAPFSQLPEPFRKAYDDALGQIRGQQP